MTNRSIFSALTAAGVTLAMTTGAQALTANGQDYDYNLSFDGVNGSIFAESQSFALGGPAEGWLVNIRAQFSQDGYADSNFVDVANTNQTGAPYQNEMFEDAMGLYYAELTNRFQDENITVKFDFTFENFNSTLDQLELAVYSAESLDNEIDTLTHSNGTFLIETIQNLTGATGNNTNEVQFTAGEEPGVGQYVTTTSVLDGDTISWTYDYTFETAEGKNMLAFNVGTPTAAVPLPAAFPLLAAAFGGLALARRRRG